LKPIEFSRLQKHRNVALMFSGGKDSLALIHLFRDHLDSLTVYHGDTGDLLPETRELVADVARTLPRFVRIESDVRGWIETTAIPSDLVPARCTPMGLMHHREGRLRICTMYECCSANRWQPWHERLQADGVTLMSAGQRKADMRTLFSPDGTTAQDMEMWLPIQDWSDDEVFAYLRSVGAPLGRFYGHRTQGPDTIPNWRRSTPGICERWSPRSCPPRSCRSCAN
jgi:3'-phosphoadenosine 5'-phosphosulfate sulfotransferase (PAPS reductase)/FAD synthetase